MKWPRLLVLLCLVGCTRTISGPTPVITGARNERDLSSRPAFLCNAQGNAADGWLVDALGDNFAPLPSNSLEGTPWLMMPHVRLDGPESYTLPEAYVRFVDKTRMPLAMRTADTSADPHALQAGLYSLTITNMNGASGTSASSVIQVIAPPTLTQVQAQPTGGTAGFANICNDQSGTLVITGTGFRTSGTPTISFLDASGAVALTLPASSVTVVSPTLITAVIPAGSFTTAQASAAGSIYTIRVSDPAGCIAPYGNAARGFGITDVKVFPTCHSLGTLALNPRFGWAQKNQVVTISNTYSLPTTQPFSGGAPTVFITAPIKGSTTAVEIPMRRVAFINANTITAVVPTCSGLAATPISDLNPGGCPNGITPGGPYTISVQDANGAIGNLGGSEGFVVVPNEPPTTASITPSAISTTGFSDLQINSGGVTSANFALTSKPQIVFPVNANIRACDLPIVSQTTSVIHAQVPTSVAQANCVEYDSTGAQVAAAGGFSLATGLYVIRVQDTADPANGDYSGLIVTNPSVKPSSGVPAGASLATARADFPMVQAGDDIGNQYLYALGGINGPPGTGTTLSSIEVAQITEFGALASFAALDRTALGYVGGTGTTAAPRHGLAAVAVQIPSDTSYIFVVGGIDASGHALTNVERAQVLKAADAPVINSPVGAATGGSMAAGSYYYKVSAVLATADPKNPGGETLASDFEPVSIGSPGGTATLTWPCIAGAVQYHIFRTVGANEAAGTEHLLASPLKTVASCTGTPLPNESYTDDGSITPSGPKPQPAGALGRWVAMTALPTARGQLAAKLVGDRLFAVGGCTATSGSPACHGAGFETNTVAIATLSGISITGYASATMTQARRQPSITVANKLTAPGEFTSGSGNLNDQWLMVLYGEAAGSVIPNSPNGVEVSKVISSGSEVASPIFGSAGYGPTSFGVTGGWAEAVADLLLVYGNTGTTAFDFRLPSGSSTLCGSGSCLTSSSFGTTLTSASVSTTNKYLPGETLFRAYVYVAGGLTDATASATAQSSVERILY